MGGIVYNSKLRSPMADAAKGGSKTALGCLLLFALPFAAFGALMVVAVVYELWLWQSALRWVETPATLQEVKLESDSSGDSTTYEVTAQYEYQFDGQRYVSDDVSLSFGKDSVGTYHKDRAAELEKILQAGGQTVCYVNARDPSRALLFRDLRPGMLLLKLMFALIFGGVGFGLLAAAFYGRRLEARKAEVAQLHPGEPWRVRDDWAAGRISSSDGKLAWFVTFFAVVWNGACWPIAILFWFDDQVARGAKVTVALFPLVGSGIAAWMIYLWLRRLQWGRSEFEMATVPGVLGGPLAGVVHAPAGIMPEAGFKLRLVCNKTTRTSSGGKSSSSTEAIFEREQTIYQQTAGNDGTSTVLPVKFLVPFDLPASDDDVSWILEVSAATLGVDYFASFEVPVFKTKTSSGAVDEEAAFEAVEEQGPTDLRTTVARLNAVLDEELPERRIIRFPMGRNVGMAAFTGLFALVWGAICVGLYLSEAPRIFPIVGGLFGLLIAYGAVRTCFGSGGLTYSSRGIEYARRCFGLGRTHEIPRGRINAIHVEKSGTKWGVTAFRKIVADTKDGEHTLVSEIARADDAERLAADIRRVVELDGESSGASLEAPLPKDFLKEKN